VRTLAASFNTMTERLEQAREALAQAEREAAWRDVARRLAHEIKNPLTPMRLSLHRLQRRADLVPDAERAAVRDSLDALLQEVEHLTRLAEHFSQYAHLPEPQREPLELGELARAVAALHEPEHVRVRSTPGAPVRVTGDRLLLSRALHNLLLNACEASPAGTEVEVRTGSGGREGWVEVLDRGPGLSAEVAASAFEPYVSTKNRGSGLGLSLVRDIAAQHEGRATLENREGGGACARLVLPLST
jgi:nitrogen fixation/metabolism regulation signal transduction histidine kinase